MLEHILKMWVRVQEAHCYSVRGYSSVLLSDTEQQGGEALGLPQYGQAQTLLFGLEMQRGERMETFTQNETKE